MVVDASWREALCWKHCVGCDVGGVMGGMRGDVVFGGDVVNGGDSISEEEGGDEF